MRVYFWHCSQESLVVGLRGPYGVLENKSKSFISKTSVLPTVVATSPKLC